MGGEAEHERRLLAGGETVSRPSCPPGSCPLRLKSTGSRWLVGDQRKHRGRAGAGRGLSRPLCRACQDGHPGPFSRVSRDAVRVRWGHALCYRKLRHRKRCRQLPRREDSVRSRGRTQGGCLAAAHEHLPQHTRAHAHTRAHVDYQREGSRESRASVCKRQGDREKGTVRGGWAVNSPAPPPQAVSLKDLGQWTVEGSSCP